ncbi:MAG: ABATE domain-containing protein [Litoreibacter sp.]
MSHQRFPFQFIGNDLALDFVNTRINVETKTHDLIDAPDQLDSWLNEVGIRTKIKDWSDTDFELLHDLRDAVQDMLQAVIESRAPAPDALKKINLHLKHHVSQTHLTYDGTAFCIQEDQTDLAPRDAMSFLASRTASLLTSTDPNRIKACAAEKCVLVFKDTSKSGRRKWCSMETCGNRTKAAKFRGNNIEV